MTESIKRNERTVASKNEDLIAEDLDLAASNAQGEADAQRLRDLDSKRKDEAVRQLIEHDINAQNGPKGAQPQDPKPPYWELRKEGVYQEVDQKLVDKAFDLIQEEQKENEEQAEKAVEESDKRHGERAKKKEAKAKKEEKKEDDDRHVGYKGSEQATPNS